MAEKLPSGSYRTRVTYTDAATGKRRSESFTGATATEADYAALEFKLKRRRTSDPNGFTVSEAVDKYCVENDAVLSPATIEMYRKIHRCWMKQISSVPLRKLTNSNVQLWINALSKKYAPHTVSNAYGLLCSVLAAYLPDVSFRVNLPKRLPADIEIPQKADIERLLSEASGTPMYLPILLGSNCGMRRSEMSALTWDDIDLKSRKIKVRRALVRGGYGWETKAPKTRAGIRTLDMTNAVYDYLAQADKNQPPVSICPDTITKQFRILCDRIGLSCNQHLLRHYFASVLASRGIPEKYAIMLMGHASGEMIRKVYAHILVEAEQRSRQSVLDYFDN